MYCGALDLVQGASGRDQDFFWRTAAVRTGTAELARLDHSDRHPGASHGACHTDPGIAAPQGSPHRIFLASSDQPRSFCRRCRRCIYLVVMVDVIEFTTAVAISNCAVRSLMLWRLAIHSKSVQTAQTSPLSSWVRRRRTGQSNPAFGL